jgi:hypothetical protein
MNIELAHNSIPCEPGLHFGSKHVVDPPYEGQVFDYLPPANLRDANLPL